MASVVKMNSRGMAKMLKEPWVYGVLEGPANATLGRAKGSAPVRSGRYQASLHTERDMTDRAVIRVVADAPHSMAVEAATGNLARALP